MPKTAITITQRNVVMTAARVVLWAFLVGGALSGYLSAAVFYESVGTVVTEGKAESLSRKAFIDALLRQIARQSAEQADTPANTP